MPENKTIQEGDDFMSNLIKEGLKSVLGPEVARILNMTEEEMKEEAKKTNELDPKQRIKQGNHLISQMPVFVVVGALNGASERYMSNPSKENLASVAASAQALLSKIVIDAKGVDYLNERLDKNRETGETIQL